MALERQSIEKKDFPIGRRGYDPDAVDAHLSRLADEVEELKRSARRRTDTLASAASEQVRAIVEAAESSAAQIQRQAEDEAREIKSEATSEAHATREDATSQARDYVGKVSESTAMMLQRLDAMEGELGGLMESLRTGANRLNADLQLLDGNLGDVREAVTPRPRFEPLADEDVGEPAAAPEAAAPAAAEEGPDGAVALDDAPVDPAAAALADGGDVSDDTEGARLIALNMALNGTPREETERYLAENFRLADRGSLLDEVYASVEG
ncbi:MAG: DivIVA domain-containing protein [Solirubrobacteraceae bacterium]